jgi:hypothetical protein
MVAGPGSWRLMEALHRELARRKGASIPTNVFPEGVSLAADSFEDKIR